MRRVRQILVHRGIHQACQRQVCQQHAEGDRDQKQRLKLLDDGKVEQEAGDSDHDQIPRILDKRANAGVRSQALERVQDVKIGHD